MASVRNPLSFFRFFVSKWFVLFSALLSVYMAHLYQQNSRIDTNRLAFSRFQNKYGKLYPSEHESELRFRNFIRNRNYIMQNSNKHFSMEMNHFGDMSMKEIQQTLLEDIPVSPCKGNNCFGCDGDECFSHDNANITALPDEVDWRLRGMVTPVKNQGRCGSCWAFAAAAGLESAWAIRKNRLADISTQQMVDCDTKSHGCNGGMMDRAYAYLIADGVALEDDYPYKARDQNCSHDFARSNVNITGFGYVEGSRPLAMKRAVSFQPITVAVAVNENFIFYSSGVFDAPCGPRLNHAVLLTGYGTSDGKFWTIKNSWGEGWGELGYMRLRRTEESNSQETCGIAMVGIYPIVGN
jgi:C1A family cysteine protease